MITGSGVGGVDDDSLAHLLQVQKDRKCVFYPICIGNDSEQNMLASLNKDGLVLLAENLSNVFVWIGNSLEYVAHYLSEKFVAPNPKDYNLDFEYEADDVFTAISNSMIGSFPGKLISLPKEENNGDSNEYKQNCQDKIVLSKPSDEEYINFY